MRKKRPRSVTGHNEKKCVAPYLTLRHGPWRVTLQGGCEKEFHDGFPAKHDLEPELETKTNRIAKIRLHTEKGKQKTKSGRAAANHEKRGVTKRAA